MSKGGFVFVEEFVEVGIREARLFGGEGDDFFVIEGDFELFGDEFTDLLAGRAVLAGDGNNDTWARFDDGLSRCNRGGCGRECLEVLLRKDEGEDDTDSIGDGGGPEDASDAEVVRQDVAEWNEENDVTSERYNGSFQRLADGLKEDGGHFDEAGEGDEEHEDAEGFDGEVHVEGVAGAEDADDRGREELKAGGGDETSDNSNDEDDFVGFADAVEFFGAEVVAEDGLGAAGEADDDVDDD